MERQINEFNLTIGGQIEQIDVHSLTTALLNLNDVLIQINSELGTNKKIELTVKTYKPGSFDIYLQLLADMTTLGVASGLFNATNLEVANKIITSFSSILSIKKFLRGRKPQSITVIQGDKIEIKNNKGNVLIVEHLHLDMLANNEKIDTGIKNIVDSLDSIPYVDDFAIKDKDQNEIFKATKKENDFNNLILPNPITELPEDQLRDKFIENAILSVYSVVFTNTRNWEFFYEGNKIPARLKDAEFIQKVLSRQISFSNGDRLKCDLFIHQKYNPVGQVFENKHYSIVKVKEVLPPEIQGILGLTSV